MLAVAIANGRGYHIAFLYRFGGVRARTRKTRTTRGPSGTTTPRSWSQTRWARSRTRSSRLTRRSSAVVDIWLSSQAKDIPKTCSDPLWQSDCYWTICVLLAPTLGGKTFVTVLWLFCHKFIPELESCWSGVPLLTVLVNTNHWLVNLKYKSIWLKLPEAICSFSWNTPLLALLTWMLLDQELRQCQKI